MTDSTATLRRHGRMSWFSARALLAGTTCAWSDLDGFHLAPADTLPDSLVGATHLWAWGSDVCYRLRLDDGEALVASLRPGAGDTVIAVRRARSWAAADRQVGPLPAEAHDLDLELLEIAGSSPVQFLRIPAAR